MVAPVTNPPSQSGGRPRASQTQRITTSSSSAATGDMTRNTASWPQAAATQLATIAAESVPPMAKPN